MKENLTKKAIEELAIEAVRERCTECGHFLRECYQFAVIAECHMSGFKNWIERIKYDREKEIETQIEHISEKEW